ncbi:hypothetical protein CLAIMM_05336, partial [Cladophialophora immunda]
MSPSRWAPSPFNLDMLAGGPFTLHKSPVRLARKGSRSTLLPPGCRRLAPPAKLQVLLQASHPGPGPEGYQASIDQPDLSVYPAPIMKAFLDQESFAKCPPSSNNLPGKLGKKTPPSLRPSSTCSYKLSDHSPARRPMNHRSRLLIHDFVGLTTRPRRRLSCLRPRISLLFRVTQHICMLVRGHRTLYRTHDQGHGSSCRPARSRQLTTCNSPLRSLRGPEYEDDDDDDDDEKGGRQGKGPGNLPVLRPTWVQRL